MYIQLLKNEFVQLKIQQLFTPVSTAKKKKNLPNGEFFFQKIL